MSSRLWCRGLVKAYRRRLVVRGVSLEVRQGEVVGLLGPNGAGKTTTFYMLVGMISPNAGQIFLDERELTFMPMYRRARLGISYLPQEPSVFRRLSVEDNIRAVLQLRGFSRHEQRERLEQLLEEFGIQRLRRHKGYMLSGGERRRCEIARALAAEPKFILLDEPFAGIDPLAVEDLMRLVRRLKTRSIGVLITDHNVHETLSITDRAYILIDGSIFYSGTAEEIAAHPEVRRLYLGESFHLERYRWE
ncbi:MAG: LPS export ABC transporter ATP-binding protein [Candidatus Kapabacteria bacterium]|nr:LPS export ABC transporter ATP-binding protein [Candidatus Kapabacteria bacterium]MCS7169748.1 LPS export ABC transporter ATP-binding protein [Candidatus Kapabacteria bacterium]MDW7997354.1 LPS export ABC transporter ATP-binding protein [Bacteroidota bacterium]MDW8225737.1 LPS export ABC transporter ATP-binding protein [Bacteroidota bacterium]